MAMNSGNVCVLLVGDLRRERRRIGQHVVLQINGEIDKPANRLHALTPCVSGRPSSREKQNTAATAIMAAAMPRLP
jgi:hypothetical protein